MDNYDPPSYWSDRLASVGGLRSTGHAAYSEEYNRWVYRRKGRVLAAALSDVATMEHAVDLGSGVGWVVEQLSVMGAAHVHGFDISEDTVAELQGRFPAHQFDALRLGEDVLPLDDGVADVVTLLDVSYHIVDDDAWENCVAEAARVLRPDAVLVVTDAFGAEEDRPAAHVRFRTVDRWHEHAAACGLRPHSLRPCYRWLSRPPSASALRFLPQRARGALEFALDAVAPSPPHLRCAVYKRVETFSRRTSL